MKTPDGKEFEPGTTSRPLAAAGAAILVGLRFTWRVMVILARAIVVVLRGIGKVIATIWRLAGALDSALWQGVKLFALESARIITLIARLTAEACRDFLRWLPSRYGRAYGAFSGFALIIMLLWIADELSISPADRAGAGEARRAPVDLDDPILARIEGRYVHLSEVAASALASGALREDEMLTPQSAFDRQLVQAYVEQKLLSRAATETGLQRQTRVARQIGALRDRILAAAYLEDRIRTIVTEEAIERLYARQVDVTRLGDEVRARHIIVKTREDADTLVTALKQGGSFKDLAREKSLDRATAAIGGDLGYFTKQMMEPELASAAFSTPVGQIAPPFETEFGWHVLEVLDRRPTEGVSLSSVKDNVAIFLRRRAIADILDQLREDNEVVYYDPDTSLSTAAPLPPAPELRPGGQ